MLPRGKYPAARALAAIAPSLRNMPLTSPLLPGEVLRGDLRETVFMPILRYGRYPNEDGEYVIRQAAVRPGDCVWDIGANIGFTALLFSRLVGEKGRVFAFKPAPRALQWLHRNVGHRENIEVFPVAASDSPGQIAFTQTHSMDQSHVVDASYPGPKIAVETIPLDNLVEAGRIAPPHYIKMDVEGHEQAALRGAARTIGQHLPVIEFEAKEDHLFRASCDILSEASKGRYDIHQVRPDGTTGPVGDRIDHTQTHDFLAIGPQDRERFDALALVRKGAEQ